MTYYIVYKTTNLVNGKQYIGYHKTDNLDDGYLGSGSILSNAIKKYGKENFTKEILRIFEDSSSALEYERILITEDIIRSDEFYNIMPGGSGGDASGALSRNYGIKKSTNHKEKLRSSRLGRFTGENNPFYGKQHTEEMKKWFSERQIGDKSPVYDNTVYKLKNHKTEENFEGTQYKLIHKFNLDPGNVNKLVRGVITSYNMWTLIGNTPLKKGPKTDQTVYTIYKGDEIFVGTRHEIESMLKTSVSRFLSGKLKTCKKWKLK